jgi:heptosyltransferase-2
MNVNKILFITLSNIGDVILTLPALDILRANFPQAKITVMSGPRAKEIFENNPFIDRLIVYDKHSRLKEKIKLFFELRKERFDLVADLRNTLFGILSSAKYKTSPFLIIPKIIRHMKDRHLYKVKSLKFKVKSSSVRINSFYIKPKDEEYIDKILRENNITDKERIFVISAGAKSHIKRWDLDKFVELIPGLIEEFKAKIILVGDRDDASITKFIATQLKFPLLDLSGKTNLTQLAALLNRAGLVITNDSAVLHLAGYLNIKIVAVFGPTNELKYRPWSENYIIVKKDIFCRPCQEAQCKFRTLDCMRYIKVEDVMRAVRNILFTDYRLPITDYQTKRILIVRTDRIGDVLLSTPVIKAMRDAYPNAYIAMMVSPYTKDIVDGNPYLDEVIIYDKDGKHKSWLGSIKFAIKLKKKRFNLAIVLHPTNRVHLITFFAGIPRRIGYNKKLGFLLTDRIKHTKQLGEKHELEYNLDLIRYLGIEVKDKNLFMPIKPESETRINNLLAQVGLKDTDKFLAIHPGASCPSKIWPNERFAQVADKLIEKYDFKVIIVAGPKDVSLAQNIIKHLHYPAVNLAGRTSVSQLASLLKRCQLFISNDSGPVHIGVAVGVPVISIFGRSQKGLSPKRWGPIGKKGYILHKEVGCIECLAHNCIKEFACLKAIGVEDVLKLADLVMDRLNLKA